MTNEEPSNKNNLIKNLLNPNQKVEEEVLEELEAEIDSFFKLLNLFSQSAYPLVSSDQVKINTETFLKVVEFQMEQSGEIQGNKIEEQIEKINRRTAIAGLMSGMLAGVAGGSIGFTSGLIAGNLAKLKKEDIIELANTLGLASGLSALAITSIIISLSIRKRNQNILADTEKLKKEVDELIKNIQNLIKSANIQEDNLIGKAKQIIRMRKAQKQNNKHN